MIAGRLAAQTSLAPAFITTLLPLLTKVGTSGDGQRRLVTRVGTSGGGGGGAPSADESGY